MDTEGFAFRGDEIIRVITDEITFGQKQKVISVEIPLQRSSEIIESLASTIGLGDKSTEIASLIVDNVNIDDLKAICISDNWSKKLLKKVNACLHKQFPDMQNCQIAEELLEICRIIDAADFRTSLERIVWKKLEDKIDVEMWLSLLIFEGNPKKDADDDSGTLSIILDFLDWEKYGHPVANEMTTDLMNSILVEAEKESAAGKQNIKSRDAFGAEYRDIGQPMPSVRIAPGLEVALRAMFHEQHCQFRYKNADDRSYPITLENRMQVQTALKWIAKPENQDYMWQRVDESAILFAYPDKLPPVIPKCAGLFGGSSSNTAVA